MLDILVDVMPFARYIQVTDIWPTDVWLAERHLASIHLADRHLANRHLTNRHLANIYLANRHLTNRHLAIFKTLTFLCSLQMVRVRVLHYKRLERLAMEKHSSLLGPIYKLRKNEVLWMLPLFFDLFLWHSLLLSLSFISFN